MSNPRTCLCWILLSVSLLTGCRQPRAENVVLIVVDTLRADHLSVYGYERNTSPGLERWAERGMVFDQAFATSSWTLPTFGSILTGLWPAQHSAGARLEKGKKWRRAPLDPSVTTLPEILKASGLTTGAIVNNAFLRPHFGAARGFDTYDYEKGRKAEVVVDLSKTWLSANEFEPFFLMLHLIDPHLPYEPPEEYLGMFGEVPQGAMAATGRSKIVKQLSTLTEEDRAHLESRYDEEIAYVDHELDRLLTHMERLGLLDRTLVILTSDHGEELFEHGGFEHGHSMYQEVLRVPLMLWGPGVPVGRRETPVSVVDIPPTIYEAIGAVAEPSLPGVSLRDAVRHERTGKPREILAQNTLWGREKKALIAWPYKMVLEPLQGRRRLFDLTNDPLERNDLAGEKPSIAKELERRLQDRLAAIESNPIPMESEITPEVEEELRALGYLD